MKVNIRNVDNAHTIHATIRMTKEEYHDLRVFMHTAEGQQIKFPYGAFIAHRGSGWYRVTSHNFKRLKDKIEFAVRTIRQFMHHRQQMLVKAHKHQIIKIGMTPVAHTSGEGWTYVDNKEREKASVHQLQQLVQKFSKSI